MSWHRILTVCLGTGWLWLATAAEVYGQPQALPPTILPGGPPGGVNGPLLPPPVGDAPVEPGGFVVGPPPRAVAPPLAEPPGPALSLPPTAWTGPWSAPPTAWTVPWSWQILPDGLMYRNYLAGSEEPRFASQWVHDSRLGGLWDVTLGGHVGMLRYGTQDALQPEGWQVDIDGAAFPRLDASRNLDSCDFRFGIPLTFRQGPWETKFGYYHLSSHLVDLYLIQNPSALATRINYVREAVVWGVAYRPLPDWRLYGEANWAFHEDGGAKPWEFQFGVEMSSMQPTGLRGTPFLAVNGSLRQDVDYGGNVTVEAGWQWRGATGHLFRVGAQYFNGKSEQRQFYRDYENFIGGGIWYDY
ncbi:MAG: DUF1207 domain-containing protein [Thermoguttaceae bacterium]